MEAYGVVSFSVRNIKNEKVAFRLDNISTKEINITNSRKLHLFMKQTLPHDDFRNWIRPRTSHLSQSNSVQPMPELEIYPEKKLDYFFISLII